MQTIIPYPQYLSILPPGAQVSFSLRLPAFYDKSRAPSLIHITPMHILNTFCTLCKHIHKQEYVSASSPFISNRQNKTANHKRNRMFFFNDYDVRIFHFMFALPLSKYLLKKTLKHLFFKTEKFNSFQEF